MAAVGYRLGVWVRARWATAIALGVVVAIAAAAVLALFAGASRTLTASDRYSSWRGATYDVAITQADGQSRTGELEALPALDVVDTATFVFGGLIPVGGDTPVDTVVFAGTQGPLGTRLVEGREPEAAAPDEFVATRSLVRSIGARVGDQFELVTLTQRQADEAGFDATNPEGPSLTATLVGVIDGPAGLEDDYPVALFPRTLLDQGDVGVSATVGAASLAPGFSRADLRRQLDALPDGDQFSLDAAEWVPSSVRAAVNAQGQGLVVVGVVVLLAALLVLGQLLSRQLRLGDDEAAALRSIGLDRRQVVAEPACRAAIPAVVGTLAGAVIAYACSAVFPVGFARAVEPHPGRRFDPLGLGLGPVLLAVGLVGWVTVVLVLDSRTLRSRSPSMVTEKVATAVPSAKLGTAVRFAFARPAARAHSVSAPLVGPTLALCVLFGALVFGVNLNRLVDDPARYGANFDLEVGAGATEISPEVERQLEASADISALTLYGTTGSTVGVASLDIVGMHAVRGDLAPEALAGRLPQGADEIALGRLAARDLGVGVGDPLVITGATGPRTLVVSGVALIPPIGGADRLGQSGLVTDEGLLALDPSAAMNTAVIRISSNVAPGAAERIAAAIGSSVGPTDPPAAIVNLRRVRWMPFLVASVVGGLALLSLSHLMIVSVRRRRRDHAVLRAIGATPRWLGGVVQWQATVTTAVVVAVAIPIGTALGEMAYQQFVERIGASTDAVVPLALLGVALVVLFPMANLAAWVPARRIRHRSPARILTED